MVAAAAAPELRDTQHFSESDLRLVIRTVRELPVGVAGAPFSLVIDRELSEDLYAGLVNQACTTSDLQGWKARLARRRQHLQCCIGRRLMCVFIRLPGVHYTIEIDPVSRSVVHWEWQKS